MPSPLTTYRAAWFVRSAVPPNTGEIAIGWNGVDFHQAADADAIFREFQAFGYRLGRWGNMIRAWKESMQKGDLVVVPAPKGIFLGVITGTMRHQTGEANERSGNFRGVDFFPTPNRQPLLTPAWQFTHGLQERFRIRRTIASLDAFLPELSEAAHSLSEGRSYQVADAFAQEEFELEQEFRKKLKQRLQFGQTYLTAGGKGLESLVAELMKAGGYDAEVLSKKAFARGDADVLATRTGWPDDEKWLIQVKHHRGQTSSWGWKQLQEIIQDKPPGYEGCRFALVTSGDIVKKFDADALDPNAPGEGFQTEVGPVSLVGGDELVDWIMECLPKLPETTRRKLGIMGVPTLRE